MKEVSKDFKSHFIGAICLSKEKWKIMENCLATLQVVKTET